MIRTKVAAILVAATAALAGIGITVTKDGGAPAHLALDCRPGESFCVAIIEPSPDQCEALHNGDPKEGLFETSTTKVLTELQQQGALESFVVLPLPGDPTRCYVEVRLSIVRGVDEKGNVTVDGQAPAWRDVIDASGVGSKAKDGLMSRRPAYGKAGGCRAHVWFGEEPCAPSEDVPEATVKAQAVKADRRAVTK